ncbi:hypothetical protein ABT040_42335 [Streptomyces sp. NPDC002688]
MSVAELRQRQRLNSVSAVCDAVGVDNYHYAYSAWGTHLHRHRHWSH